MTAFSINGEPAGWQRGWAALLVALLLTSGQIVPLAVQAVGWGYMIARTAPGQNFSEVVASTFNGNQPCGFCRVARLLSSADGDVDDEALNRIETASPSKFLVHSAPAMATPYRAPARLPAAEAVPPIAPAFPPEALPG